MLNNPEIEMLEARIAADTARLKELKNECTHPGLDRQIEYKSDTNHWCAVDNAYWVEIRCPHCTKFWKLGDESWAYRDPRGSILPPHSYS